MNPFMDEILDDINKVFLNLDEFGEEITLEGVPGIPAVVDGVHSTTSDATDGRAGVTYEVATVYFKNGYIPKPRREREVSWNGEIWFANDVREEAGLIVLDLVREKS